MKKKIPRLISDAQAARFVESADLSEYDLTEFKPVTFEFQSKAAQLNMRVPGSLLDAVKQRARAQGIPYTRYIRQLMEQAVGAPRRTRDLVSNRLPDSKTGTYHEHLHASSLDDDVYARVGKMTDTKELFIERREEGDYAVRRPDSQRASAVEPTQAEAIERARQLAPSATLLVERVRRTAGGKPDKWRKP